MEKQAELEIKKIHLDTLRQIMLARMQVIITCATIVAAILVVATFGETFIQKTESLQWIIIFLLNLIPIALFDYSFKLNKGEISIMKELDPEKLNNMLKSPLFVQAIRRSDLFYALGISISILFVISLILQQVCLTLLIGIVDFFIIYMIERYS